MVPLLPYKIVNTYSHDPNNFTQGLTWHKGYLYESTGLYGESRLFQRNFRDNQLLREAILDSSLFGEGIAIYQNQLYQLTWKEGIILVYDLPTLTWSHQLYWEREGWGICQNGEHLILSDGTNQLYFLDPHTQTVDKILKVKYYDQPIFQLNDLEYIDNKIYANVLNKDQIITINPDNGQVLETIDISNLRQIARSYDSQAGVCNGICYYPIRGTLLITGKNWPILFEGGATPPPSPPPM